MDAYFIALFSKNGNPPRIKTREKVRLQEVISIFNLGNDNESSLQNELC